MLDLDYGWDRIVKFNKRLDFSKQQTQSREAKEHLELTTAGTDAKGFYFEKFRIKHCHSLSRNDKLGFASYHLDPINWKLCFSSKLSKNLNIIINLISS